MDSNEREANPPADTSRLELPLLVFDGDCGFCRRWIERWRKKVPDEVEFRPYQEVAGRFPQIPEERFVRSVQLIMPGGEVYSGAEAVFRVLAHDPASRWMLWVYKNVPLAAPASEAFYRAVAKHRPLASKISAFMNEPAGEQTSFQLCRWVFLRLLGITYLFAFLSLLPQLPGLVGSNGILPADLFLGYLRQAMGPERYWYFPTIAWINPSDAFLQGAAGAGAFFSVLLILGVAAGPTLTILYVLYLSLATVGRVFLSFQWDALLLEAGFLAILLAPWSPLSPPWAAGPRWTRQAPPSRIVIWLFRWLLFRLVFLSGAVKLLSGDQTWLTWQALKCHFETQPLPTPVGWFFHQLPGWFLELCVPAVFFLELCVPMLIFAPRGLRIVAAGLIAWLQLLIALNGNYTFFNFLTISFCVLLLDDRCLRKLVPARLARSVMSACSGVRPPPCRKLALVPAGALLLILTATEFAGAIIDRRLIPEPLRELTALAAPFQIANSYGVFAVMTTSRPEIVIEGSRDGTTWYEYEFPYKPGDVDRPPPWVAPYQPRLDWQMWFAALSDFQHNPWFVNFMVRLLEGSPEVLALLKTNPFAGTAPVYVRARLYDYRFSDPQTRSRTGAWWTRRPKGMYMPAFALEH